MKLQEAIAILKAHNEWRRGGEGPMTDPTELGIAIDTVVDDFASVRKIELTASDVEEICKIFDRLMQRVDNFYAKHEEELGYWRCKEALEKKYPYLKEEEDYYTEVLRRFKEGKK